jgi:hypothetical protein
MSSQAFHRTPDGRIQKITAGEQFKPRILESFDPVTLRQTGFENLQESNHSVRRKQAFLWSSIRTHTEEMILAPEQNTKLNRIEARHQKTNAESNEAEAQISE